MAKQNRKVSIAAMKGGVIQNVSQMLMPPGALVNARNYQVTLGGGYQRIYGYERFDGQPAPSEQSFYVLSFENGSIEITEGDLVEGFTSSASGEALIDAVLESGTYAGGDAAGYLILGLLEGTFSTGEDLEVSSVKHAEAVGTQRLEDISDPDLVETYIRDAMETARADILDVGNADSCEGPVRGVCMYKDVVYAFRNNSGSSACSMYKATTDGWELCDLGHTLWFTAGDIEPVEGETVSGASATATIKRIIKTGGDWGHADLVTNGGFDADTDWTKGANWAIASGVATHTSGAVETLSQDLSLTPGATYHVTFDVVGRTAGDVTVSLGGTAGTTRSTNDTFEEDIVCGSGGSPDLVFTPSTAFDGDIDNVVVSLHGDATGRLIIDTVVSGPFGASEEITAPSGFNATTNGANAANTLEADGRFEFVIDNFYAGVYSPRLYGCDGVSKAFEWDGDTFVPIITGMTTDTPTHIAVFKNHLFLAFPGSVQHSDLGLPYSWTGLLGAAEIGMPDTVTGFSIAPGNVLAILGRSYTKLLYGTSIADWDLKTLSDQAGAIEWSIQRIGQMPYVLDDLGITSLQTTDQYGDFASAVLSESVDSLAKAKRNALTCSATNKTKGQYRLFFSDGSAIYMTLGQDGVRGFMPQQFEDVPLCAFSGEDSSGIEHCYFGTSSGHIYRLDKGNNFDGEAIEGFLVFPFAHQNSIEYKKKYIKLVLETNSDIDPGTTMTIKVEYSDANPEIPAMITTDIDLVGSDAGLWDVDKWDEFVWDGLAGTRPTAYLQGVGTNARIILGSINTYIDPHTIFSYMLHYSMRGLQR